MKQGTYNTKREEYLDLVKEEFGAFDPYKLDRIWDIDPNSNYRSDIHVYGPNQDTAYDIQLKGAIKSNGGQENRSVKDYSSDIPIQ